MIEKSALVTRRFGTSEKEYSPTPYAPVVGGLFVPMFTSTWNRWKIDDVLGVWGAIAAGIFGTEALGGLGGGFIVYWALKMAVGLRLDAKGEINGADLSIHHALAGAERGTLG